MADAPDFIPDGQMPSAEPVAAATPQPSGSPDFIPDGQFQADEDKFSGTGETIKAGLEGAGRGLIGSTAMGAIERHGFGVPKANILGRQEAHPIVGGLGEVAGLTAGALTGTGEAAVLGKAGEAAAGLAGLSEAGKGASYATRVGSSLVKQAAEMAVMQGDNEVAKLVLNDPKASSESALANIGLAAALGGAGGALGAGVVSPLWKVSGGPKLTEALSGLTSHLNGNSLEMPEVVNNAVKDLGLALDATVSAALSGDPKALEYAQDLYRGEHRKFMEHLESLPKAAQESVAQSLGTPLEDLISFSKADAGREARDTFINELYKKYGPIAEKLQKRNAMAATISLPDEARRDFGSKIMEHAIGPKGPGTNSDYYQIYEKYAQRVMGADTVGELDKIRTELGKMNSLNGNERDAYNQLRSMIGDFQEQQINRQGRALEKQGSEYASAAAKDLVKERQATNTEYAQYRRMMEELNGHARLGDFHGTGTLKTKLNEKLSPEDFLNKFSPKNNSEAIGFLQKNFPETAAKLQDVEKREFLAKHVKTHLGEPVVDYKTLSNAVEKLQKGSPEYAKYVLPDAAISKIQSAKTLNDALGSIKNIKNSGTPAGLAKVFKHMGASAIGAIGYLMGHNPISGMLLGEMAGRLGKDAPEAIKYSLLHFLGSDKPIKAEGFKAMVDFIHQSMKGEQRLTNAVGEVFGNGVRVLAKNNMPSEKDQARIDKAITKLHDDPQELNRLAEGDIGHYMPNHQTALSQTMGTQLKYLEQLKPKEKSTGPLDNPIQPSAAAEPRYNRALSIAADPTVVLARLKNGQLQSSDLVDLKNMYPSMYTTMANKITTQMAAARSKGETIDYKTRMGLSLFLGQPLDSTMSPMAIQAAQPPSPQPMQQQGGGSKKPSAKASTSMNKEAKEHQTQSQAAESDRAGRD